MKFCLCTVLHCAGTFQIKRFTALDSLYGSHYNCEPFNESIKNIFSFVMISNHEESK